MNQKLVLVDGDNLVDAVLAAVRELIQMLRGASAGNLHGEQPHVDAHAAPARSAPSCSSGLCKIATSVLPSGVIARPSSPRLACRPALLRANSSMALAAGCSTANLPGSSNVRSRMPERASNEQIDGPYSSATKYCCASFETRRTFGVETMAAGVIARLAGDKVGRQAAERHPLLVGKQARASQLDVDAARGRIDADVEQLHPRLIAGGIVDAGIELRGVRAPVGQHGIAIALARVGDGRADGADAVGRRAVGQFA